MKPFPSQDKSYWGFRYAISGLWYVIRKESHFRFHICAAIGTAMFTEYYKLSKLNYALLAIAIVLVLSAEIMNTAVEHVVDLCTNEYHEKAKRAKDVSAAFVLVCSIFAIYVAYVIFFDTKILFESLINTFTRVKYIVFYVFTFFFVWGKGIKIRGEKNDR